MSGVNRWSDGRAKRASAACSSCHARRVRCDASRLGMPCSNCKLDGRICTMRDGARKKQVPESLDRLEAVETNAPPGGQKRPYSHPQPMPQPEEGMAVRITPPETTSTATNEPSPPHAEQAATAQPQPVEPVHFYGEPGVLFFYHRWLSLDNFSNLSETEAKMLEKSGCLHVPRNPALDEFMHQYFLNVHPGLPVISEADFWRAYKGDLTAPQISLFLFHAMLFAVCPFIPPKVLQGVGYDDVAQARQCFYSKAKFLYDLNAEVDPLAKAQGSVLLTYQFTFQTIHASRRWLKAARLNAKMYFSTRPNQTPALGVERRLWWSIYFRDRITSLGLRRPIQVYPTDSSFGITLPGEEDFGDEINDSAVYNAETKRHVARIFNLHCRLATVLTTVVSASYRQASNPSVSANDSEERKKEVEEAKAQLASWKAVADACLPFISEERGVHRLVVLFSDLPYIHYHAALVALYHHECSLVDAFEGLKISHDEESIDKIGEDIEKSSREITQLVRRCIAHGFAQHLPISVFSCVAMPYLLNSLDARLSPAIMPAAEEDDALDYYEELMSSYNNRYGVGSVLQVIDRVLSFAGISTKATPYTKRLKAQGASDIASAIAAPGPTTWPYVKNWRELFLRQPRIYLHISLALDYAFGRGDTAEEKGVAPVLEVGDEELAGSTADMFGIGAVPFDLAYDVAEVDSITPENNRDVTGTVVEVNADDCLEANPSEHPSNDLGWADDLFDGMFRIIPA